MGKKWNEVRSQRRWTAKGVVTSLGLLALTGPSACGADAEGFESLEDVDSLQSPLGPPVTVAFQDGVAPSSAYAGTADTTLAEAAPTTNRGTQTTCYADGNESNGDDLSCLLRWTLSGIPAGSVVQSASITLRVTNGTANTYTVYALKRAWVETQATWQRATSSVTWQTAGALGANDRGAAVGTITGGTGARTVTLNAAGVALVQSWVDSGSTNHGVIIHSASNSDGLDVASSETSTLANRPRLSITYAPPDGGGSGGSGGTGGSGAATSTVPDLLVAFIGDQGANGNSDAVLQLIAREGAAAAVHNGDFDYADNPTAWNNRINGILGPNYPYFAVIGNHDAARWSGTNGYASFIAARHARVPEMQCTGELGVKASCKFRGLHLITSCVGTGELRSSCGANSADQVAFLRDTLTADNSIWSVCNWHKNQNDMQLGSKGNEVGWLPYQECMNAGAIVATGHEHSYARTKTLTNVGNVSAGHGATGAFDLMQLGLGRNFVFVSGLGGVEIRDYEAAGHADDTWWASQYASNRWLENGVVKPVGTARYGATFIRFNVDGDPRKATGYFKTVTDQVIDTFTIRAQ